MKWMPGDVISTQKNEITVSIAPCGVEITGILLPLFAHSCRRFSRGSFEPKRALQIMEYKVQQTANRKAYVSARFFSIAVNIRTGNGPRVIFPIYGFIAKLFIKPGGGYCKQHDPAKIVKTRVVMNALHEPSAKPFTLILLKYVNIAKISEGGIVCYQPRESYLGFIMIHPKVKAVFY